MTAENFPQNGKVRKWVKLWMHRWALFSTAPVKNIYDKLITGTVPVGNCFWIFPDLFSVALPGKTCAIYHSSFYWYNDIRCISCSSDWEVRSSQNRVFPTRNIEKSANSERRRLVNLNCKMNTEISPVKTSRNWDKERDQIEGRGTALCVSAICCLFFFFHAWSVWCTLFSDTHDST